MISNDAIVWIDLEMSGLNPLQDKILEIATIITDSNLSVIAEGPELTINQPESLFATMDDWNQEHHTKSGLWEKVINSKISLEEAESQTLAFIKKHCSERSAPLAGNSIWQDRRFLSIHMVNLNEFLHYRIIDVSSIKELTKRWYPDKEYKNKKGAHRALDDIKESIEELHYYKANVFKEIR